MKVDLSGAPSGHEGSSRCEAERLEFEERGAAFSFQPHVVQYVCHTTSGCCVREEPSWCWTVKTSRSLVCEGHVRKWCERWTRSALIPVVVQNPDLQPGGAFQFPEEVPSTLTGCCEIGRSD